MNCLLYVFNSSAPVMTINSSNMVALTSASGSKTDCYEHSNEKSTTFIPKFRTFVNQTQADSIPCGWGLLQPILVLDIITAEYNLIRPVNRLTYFCMSSLMLFTKTKPIDLKIWKCLNFEIFFFFF